MTIDRNSSENWQEEQAHQRFLLISPLLDPNLDTAKKLQLREQIAQAQGISVRTLYRYEKAYLEGGFSGLKPMDRQRKPSARLPENFGDLIQEAILLKREVPSRSVRQIIQILELEGKAAPGELKRSTMERHLYNAGFSVRQMKMYRDARESSSRRFCKPHRMMLVQADIKYGPKLPIGKNRAKIQTYLSSAIDDHSRFLLASRFYDNQEEGIVEDTMRSAITQYGKFDVCYFDNGSQYVARQLNLSLSRLGIQVRKAPVRSGKSKGKIEKFHQVVDRFLAEAKLKNVKTLEELNRLWEVYLEESYHNLPHSGIAEYYESLGADLNGTGITPREEFNRDSRALCYLDTSVVAEAFLHHETRKVDQGACISFRGQKYETKGSLIGCTVEISYDPRSPERLTVRYPGVEPFTASPVKIGAFCEKLPALPESMQQLHPTTSRLLDALDKTHTQNRRQLTDALSFADYRKEGSGHV